MPSKPTRKQRPWLQGSHKSSKARVERNKIYGTAQWRKLRLIHIRQQPLCVECNAPGQVVDHITPIRMGGEPFDMANLQTMCHKCHNIKSGKEAHL
jgi:5-methylcytosine-specific restriction protein A